MASAGSPWLRVCDRAHPHQPGSATEPVSPASAEHPCAAPGEDEAQRLVEFHEPVDLVEQLGQLLDLVNDDDAVTPLHCSRALTDQVRGHHHRAAGLRVQQVEKQRIREGGTRQRGLARLARSEQEETPLGDQGGEVGEAPEQARSLAQAGREIQWHIH